ncbi:hypothetical protein [Sporolactobacillus spathodeae]|uniref:Tellurium resistance membrane protein TerC n=1 Tax=Sporolactobacillus spathodeae TaxID=1465502 RepID=A0ABS2QB71_9BACL|nr:hypothetical protein [Sporolactobacillus spathodeae]MBM7659057.1 putative tellurium resistance membrane protein TerC [Sporolactobacillus spathodeae]
MTMLSLGTIIFPLVTFILLLALIYFVIMGIIFFTVHPKEIKKQNKEILEKLTEISEKLDQNH